MMIGEFFVAAWNSVSVRQQIEEKAKTTSGIWKINQAHVASISIPVPPVSDQQAALALIRELQARIDSVSKLQFGTATELDALLPSILDRAFKGEL